MRPTTALLLILAATVPNAVSAQVASPIQTASKPAQLPADSMEIARKYTQWFYSNNADSLLAHSDAATRARQGARAQYESLIADLASRAGTEKLVIEEKFITRNGARQYWRTAMFSDFAQPLLLRWVINVRGELAGVGLGPASQAPPIDP